MLVSHKSTWFCYRVRTPSAKFIERPNAYPTIAQTDHNVRKLPSMVQNRRTIREYPFPIHRSPNWRPAILLFPNWWGRWWHHAIMFVSCHHRTYHVSMRCSHRPRINGFGWLVGWLHYAHLMSACVYATSSKWPHFVKYVCIGITLVAVIWECPINVQWTIPFLHTIVARVCIILVSSSSSSLPSRFPLTPIDFFSVFFLFWCGINI